MAHERIALVTFRQMVSQHCYAFMSVNLSTIDDLALLKKYYRSFVFSYLQKQLRKETKQPGQVMQDARLKAVYSRRQDVSVIPLLIKVTLVPRGGVLFFRRPRYSVASTPFSPKMGGTRRSKYLFTTVTRTGSRWRRPVRPISIGTCNLILSCTLLSYVYIQ